MLKQNHLTINFLNRPDEKHQDIPFSKSIQNGAVGYDRAEIISCQKY